MSEENGIQCHVTEAGPCRKTLHIEITPRLVDETFDTLAKKFQAQAKIPGFRPGRAPEPVVRKRFARELGEEARTSLVSAGYRAAVGREKLDVVALLNVEDKGPEEGRAFEVTLTVDVPPEFPLPEYRAISIEGHAVKVTDEQVDTAQENLRDRLAEYIEVKDRAVQPGDRVLIDFVATSDGRPLSELSPSAHELDRAEGVWCQADEGAFIPDLGTQLVGASIGDHCDVEVSFDERYKQLGLAGHKARFAVDIKALREKKLPEWTPELLSGLECKSMDELRTRLRDGLMEDARREEKARLRNEIVRRLLDGVSFDLPETVVQQETRSAVYDMVRARTARGATRERIQNDKDALFEEAAHGARERLKLRYILHRIADKEGISVEAKELRDYLDQMARASGMEPSKLRAELEKRNTMGNVEEDLRSRKTLDWLLGIVRAAGDNQGAQAPANGTAS